MPVQTVWDTELGGYEGDLLATAPVIRWGEWVVGAIDQGLAELRRRGQIARVMQEVGLFEPRVAGWTPLNPTAQAAETIETK